MSEELIRWECKTCGHIHKMNTPPKVCNGSVGDGWCNGKDCFVRLSSLPSPDYQRGQEEMRERAAKICDIQHDRARTSTGAARADACAVALPALPAQQESVCEWVVTGEGTADTRFKTECGINRRIMGSTPCEGELCYCGRPIHLGGGA